MKKNIILILLLTLTSLQMMAVRAYPHPKTIVQPDGSTLTIIGHGDEFRHYVTTTDGYTVVKGSDGIYRYAISDNGHLKPSQVKASNTECRSVSDMNYLRSIEPGLKPSTSAVGTKLRKLSDKKDAPLFRQRNTAARKVSQSRKTARTPYKGLVIMVNFTDRKFSRADNAWQLVNDMMNRPGRTSYDDLLLKGRITCTGSVRDYFSDNSNGSFVPEFDVMGPIEVDVSQYYINGTELTYELCRKVLETADTEIDYSRYDSDGDGVVDMFYILYAGYASVYQGNDTRLVWPHAGHFEDFEDTGKELTLDGMRFGRFACSSEIYGWHDEGDLYLDGIGVIVHEFSHVLGFKDHYDVSGYLNEDPGTWDVMAAGNYNGSLNDTPCGYNSYEKFAAGFITPRTVTRADSGETLTLRSLLTSDDAVRIVSTQDSTVFMIENRQLEKWDKNLPGHGMLVWRVDSCDREYWEHNALNVNERPHFKLVRANGATRTLFREIEDMDYDPFPGTRNIYELTNYSIESNLLSNRDFPSPVMLRDIEETDGVICFTLEEDEYASDKPYTFRLNEHYEATGTSDEAEECNWHVHTGTVALSGGRERQMIYNLVPDTKNISASDPKYADGLGATYMISGDKKNIIIEPSRVALTGDYGVWLADFNDLDNGGSGAIMLDMDPYGNISLSDTESVLGYCLMPRNSVVLTSDKIIERFSVVKNIKFDSSAGIGNMTATDGISYPATGAIFNMQGIRVTSPQRGDIYIIDGKKIRY